MSLVPYTFPLFNLPILAIQHVADFWNPFEIYNLSRISKRAKGIAKLVSKRPESILLDKQNVRIGYLNDHTYSNREIEWHIILSREQNPDDYKYLCTPFPQYHYFSKNPLSELLKVGRHVMEVFKMSKITINLNNPDHSLEETIKWISSRNQFQVSVCNLIFANEETFRMFSESYRMPTDILSIEISSKFQDSVLPDDFKLDQYNYVIVDRIEDYNLFVLHYIDAPKLDFYFFTTVKSGDLGDILKNWQSGKCHSKLRILNFYLDVHCKIVTSELLERIEVIETRSVKQYVQLENELYWLEEEAVINGPNGKLATIQIRKFMFHMKYAEEAWHPDYDNPVVRQMDDEECDELYLVVQ